MKKLTLTITAMFVLAIAANSALAFGPLDVEAGMAMNSQYVWRGMTQTPDAVMQTTLGIGLMGLQLGFFGNMNMGDTNHAQSKFTESDWTLGYEMSLPFLSFGVGATRYAYPNSPRPGTTEVYARAAASILLSPSVSVFQDIDQTKGAYWRASIQHSLPVGPSVDLDLTAALGLGSPGYTGGYFGAASLLPQLPSVPGNATTTDYAVTAAVPFKAALFFRIIPSVTYTSLLGDLNTIVDGSNGALYNGDSSTVTWGLNAVFNF